MPSLCELHAAHGQLLVIDAASSQVQLGLLAPNSPAKWEQSDEEAGVAVFRCHERLGVEIGDVGAMLFCDGPGSILGIRTVAVALRTWRMFSPRPIFSYCSLALVAHAMGRHELSVIADARRESWHQYRMGDRLRRVSAVELAGPLAMPENFRHWSPLPPNVELVPYSVANLLSRAQDAQIFDETDSPDAFLHAEPSYVKWTPQIHRAPVP